MPSLARWIRTAGVVGAVVLASVLSGCRGSHDSARADEPPVSSAARGADVSCALAPPSLVNTTLDTHVGQPESSGSLEDEIRCTYSDPGGEGAIVRFATGVDDGVFASTRFKYSYHDAFAVTDLPGFGDQAFSATMTDPSAKGTTLVP